MSAEERRPMPTTRTSMSAKSPASAASDRASAWRRHHPSPMTAWAAARRAIGTRNGEQVT